MYFAELRKGEKERNKIQKRTIYFVSHASNSVVRGLMTSK